MRITLNFVRLSTLGIRMKQKINPIFLCRDRHTPTHEQASRILTRGEKAKFQGLDEVEKVFDFIFKGEVGFGGGVVLLVGVCGSGAGGGVGKG